MSQPEDTAFGRCQATAKSTGEQCGRAAVGEHGKCGYHGGKTPTKEENPNVGNGDQDGNGNALKHGARSRRSSTDLYDGLDPDAAEWVDGCVAAYIEAWGWPDDHPDRPRLVGACVDIWRERRIRDTIVADGPSEERVVGVTDFNEPIIATDEHHLSQQASRISTDIRQTLKDLREQGDDDVAQLADGVQSLAEALGSRGDS